MAETSSKRFFSYPEFRPVGSESLSVFEFQDILVDLWTLRNSASLPENPAPPDVVSDDEWQGILNSLSNSLGPAQDSEGCEAWSERAGARARHAVARRILKAERALHDAVRATESGIYATGVLLPTSFARRVDVLLGKAVLPVAWVGRIDILRY